METKANAKGEEIYYVPICRENGCNGNLIISIDEYLFQVNCFCEKNNNHNYKLYFDTFDKFYLKEKIIKRCSYCFNKIVNKIFYKCDQCHQLYCSNCFIYDKHIKVDLTGFIRPELAFSSLDELKMFICQDTGDCKTVKS